MKKILMTALCFGWLFGLVPNVSAVLQEGLEIETPEVRSGDGRTDGEGSPGDQATGDPSSGPIDPVPDPHQPGFPSGACPGKLEENFEVEAVRAHFYTGQRGGVGIKNPLYVETLGEGGTSHMIYLQEDPTYYKWNGGLERGWSHINAGWLLPGWFYNARPYSQSGVQFTSLEFSKMKIGMGSLLSGNNAWFLGGMWVEILKKGCDGGNADHWTIAYINPFVRTWIDSSHPLLVSPEDVVAIFGFHMGSDDNASSDGNVHVSTPLETSDSLFAYHSSPIATTNGIRDTPKLDYSHYDDFQSSHVEFYGWTYFAEPQPWTEERSSRLIGSFHQLSEKDLFRGFNILVEGSDDGVELSRFDALLIHPQMDRTSTSPFVGYHAARLKFWVDPEDCGFFGFLGCDHYAVENVMVDSMQAHEIENFGDPLRMKTAKGLLDWAVQYDRGY